MCKRILNIAVACSISIKLPKSFLEKTNTNKFIFKTRSKRIDSKWIFITEAAVSGNANYKSDLSRVISNKDEIISELSGNLGTMAKYIIYAMNQIATGKLIISSSMGIYHDIHKDIDGWNLKEKKIC